MSTNVNELLDEMKSVKYDKGTRSIESLSKSKGQFKYLKSLNQRSPRGWLNQVELKVSIQRFYLNSWQTALIGVSRSWVNWQPWACSLLAWFLYPLKAMP